MAGLIPKDFISDLISRIDIVHYINHHLPLKHKGQNYFACCPFHDEKSASFSVNSAKQIYYCFGCGVGGNIVSFVMAYERISFVDAIEQLADTLGLEVPREGGSSLPAVKKDDYQLLAQVNQYYQQQLREHPDAQHAIDYLKNRGLTGKIAQTFQIGFAPSGWHNLEHVFAEKTHQDLINCGMLIQKADSNQYYDRYRNRIIFPIYDYRSRIVGFGGRVIDNKDNPKYLNSPETALFKKSRELYGLYHALKHHQQLPRAVIVEGYMDVVALAQHGINYAVATLGTATSSSHLQLLSRYTKQMIFCFDGDNAGTAAAWRALTHCLKLDLDGLDIRFLFLPDGEDPDSLVRKIGKDKMEQQFIQSHSLADYFLHHLQRSIDISSMHGRANLLKQANPYFESMPISGTRQLLLERLAQLVRIDAHRLETMMQSNQPTETSIKAPSANKRLSAQQLTIVLLIQNPQYAKNQALQQYSSILNQIGYTTITQILDFAAKNSNININTANLLEIWRESDKFEKLSYYTNYEHYVPEAGIENELLGLFDKLTKKHTTQLIQQLMNKANFEGTLNDDERKQLQKLIKISKQD